MAQPTLHSSANIDWNNKNWPPLLRVAHFSPDNDPIPQQCKIIIKWLHATARAVVTIHFLNIWTTIGLVVGGADFDKAHIMFAVLHFIIGSSLVLTAMWQGYRGIAGGFQTSVRTFWALWTVQIIFLVAFVIVYSGNIHGYMAINTQIDNPKDIGAWNAVAAFEATAFLCCLLAAIFSLWCYYRYPGHAEAKVLQNISVLKYAYDSEILAKAGKQKGSKLDSEDLDMSSRINDRSTFKRAMEDL